MGFLQQGLPTWFITHLHIVLFWHLSPRRMSPCTLKFKSNIYTWYRYILSGSEVLEEWMAVVIFFLFFQINFCLSNTCSLFKNQRVVIKNSISLPHLYLVLLSRANCLLYFQPFLLIFIFTFLNPYTAIYWLLLDNTATFYGGEGCSSLTPSLLPLSHLQYVYITLFDKANGVYIIITVPCWTKKVYYIFIMLCYIIFS